MLKRHHFRSHCLASDAIGLCALFSPQFSCRTSSCCFRGFGVLQIHRGTGWPFWAVVWPSSILALLVCLFSSAARPSHAALEPTPEKDLSRLLKKVRLASDS